MRKRLDVAGRHGQHRVEQAGQRDPLSLSDQLEVTYVRVEGAAAAAGDAQPALVPPEDDLLIESTPGCLEGQLDRVPTVRLGGDERDDLRRYQSVDPQTRPELLEQHVHNLRLAACERYSDVPAMS
ncbi:hypothetical protein ABT167_17625 [Streptomyces sp. NPDC001792]|uniref:hypothetical protein n=1 Tax=Streptomyces sp. NPDC001792 TaxID=3154524 RepID=UPI003334868F